MNSILYDIRNAGALSFEYKSVVFLSAHSSAIFLCPHSCLELHQMKLQHLLYVQGIYLPLSSIPMGLCMLTRGCSCWMNGWLRRAERRVDGPPRTMNQMGTAWLTSASATKCKRAQRRCDHDDDKPQLNLSITLYVLKLTYAHSINKITVIARVRQLPIIFISTDSEQRREHS